MDATKAVSPTKFLEDLFESEENKQAFKAHLKERKIVSQLAALRASKGVSQAELAAQMGCRQARVSKLEAGVDANLTMADLEAYAKVTDSEVAILLSDRGKNLAAQIKLHAFSIRRSFMKLVELAHQDKRIAEGVAKFHIEAFENLNRILAETAEKLPPAENGMPYLQISTADLSSEEHEKIEESSPEQKKSRKTRSRRKAVSAG